MGDNASAVSQAMWPMIQDQVLIDYLSGIRTRLLAGTRLGPVPGHIYVADSPSVFAFTVSNGDIFLSRGALVLAENEAELASVIGHEVGHLVLGHFGKARTQQAKLDDTLTRGGRQADTPRKEMNASFATVMTFGYSRERETEADRFMLELQERAGYDPCGIHAMFSKVVALGDQNDPTAGQTQLFDTHPATPDRLQWVDAELGRRRCNQASQPSASYRTSVTARLPAR